MNKPLIALATALAVALPATAQQPQPVSSPSPGEIVAGAAAEDWVAIAPEDLVVMTLAPDAHGKPRQVVIQLIPAPFSQGWVENIRTLARAHWYDGIAVTRVQDNYVVQWGDPNGEDAAKAKALPEALRVMTEQDYAVSPPPEVVSSGALLVYQMRPSEQSPARFNGRTVFRSWPSSNFDTFIAGFPFSGFMNTHGADAWPVHCYGMVGVGRNYSPDTGTGAELYTVIGHAPRHLDRNIALVGRVVEGIEHLSSLPRGTGQLGFYESPAEHTPIVSIRVASDLPTAEQPVFQYLSTESEIFARYVEARANRRDPFFIVPARGADICNVPVPVRRVP